MATDLRVTLPNRPGSLVRLFDALRDSGIPVEGASGDLRPGERWGFVHVLVDDGATARQAIERAGFEVTSERIVELIDLESRPGAIAEACRDYADAGRNIDVVYMASGNRLVLATEDMLELRYGVNVLDARA